MGDDTATVEEVEYEKENNQRRVQVLVSRHQSQTKREKSEREATKVNNREDCEDRPLEDDKEETHRSGDRSKEKDASIASTSSSGRRSRSASPSRSHSRDRKRSKHRHRRRRGESLSRRRDRDRHDRKRKKDRKHRHRRHDSSTDDSSRHGRHKRKHSRGRRHDKKSKHKHEKRHEEMTSTNTFGKYGVIKESDFYTHRRSFEVWLTEVKNIPAFSGPKYELMNYFKEFCEDYNTATFPHPKYYDYDKWEMEEYSRNKAQAEAKGGMVSDELKHVEEMRRRREDKKRKEEEMVLGSMSKEKIQEMKDQARLRRELAVAYSTGDQEKMKSLQRRLEPDQRR